MHSQRGATLLELTIAVGIVAAVLLTLTTYAGGRLPFRLRSARTQFESLLARATATAQTSGNGATIAFLPGNANGTTLATLYSGRPNNAPTMRQLGEAIALPAEVAETTLGTPPFAVFLDSAGNASGIGSYPTVSAGTATFAPLAKEPSCATSLVLTFSTADANESRTLACRVTTDAAPDALVTMPP